jgi:hypothetical protein
MRLRRACFNLKHAFLLHSVNCAARFVLGADVHFAAAWHTDTFFNDQEIYEAHE